MRKPLSLSLRSIRSPRSVCGFSKNRSDIWLASRINEGKRSTLLFLSSRFFHFSSLSVLFSTLKFLGEKRETEDNCRNSGTVHFERITVDFSILKLEGKRKKEERVILPLFFDSQIRWRKKRNRERERGNWEREKMAQHLPLPYKGKRGGTGWQGTGPGDRTSALLPSFTDRYADTRIQETGRTIIDHRYIGRYTPFIPVQASRRHPPPANKHDTRRYSRPSPAEDTNGTERIEFESMERGCDSKFALILKWNFHRSRGNAFEGKDIPRGVIKLSNYCESDTKVNVY